jgi:hypothetical protein
MRSSIRRFVSHGIAVAIIAALLLATAGLGTAFAHTGVDVWPVVVADGNRDGHSVRLVWGEVIGAVSYTVAYRLLGDPGWLVPSDAVVHVKDPAPLPHGASITVTALTPGSTYQFEVAARNASGNVISTSPVLDVQVTGHPVVPPKSGTSAGRPWTRYVVGHDTRFVVYGSLRPAHQAGTSPVMLMCYRLENGTWVLRKTASIGVPRSRAGDRSKKRKYAGYLRLPLKGRWRIVATHAQAGCQMDVSAPRYFRVR